MFGETFGFAGRCLDKDESSSQLSGSEVPAKFLTAGFNRKEKIRDASLSLAGRLGFTSEAC
jgi:hypothetical protein